MPEEWIEEGLEMRSRGLNYSTIAKRLGQPYGVVYRRLKQREPGTGKRRVCEGCGDVFWALPSESRRGPVKFCSRECFNENPPRQSPEAVERIRQAMKKRKGRKNPNYRHGRATGQSREVTRAFNLAKKGEHACRVCGSDRNVQAHHAVPRSLSPAGKKDLRNCLPLCGSCHMAWHRGRPITRDHFTAEEWAFIETLIGPGWLEKRYPRPLIGTDKEER